MINLLNFLNGLPPSIFNLEMYTINFEDIKMTISSWLDNGIEPGQTV